MKRKCPLNLSQESHVAARTIVAFGAADFALADHSRGRACPDGRVRIITARPSQSAAENVISSTRMGEWYGLVVGALATWRLTHLLNAEDGPWQLVVRLRRAAGDGVLGELLDCFYCLSVWTATPLAVWLGHSWRERLLLIPALSAAAILIERSFDRSGSAPMPLYREGLEDPDGVLRKESDAGIEAGDGPGEQRDDEPR